MSPTGYLLALKAVRGARRHGSGIAASPSWQYWRSMVEIIARTEC